MLARVRSLAADESARVVAFLVACKLAFVGFVALTLELFPNLFSARGYWANFHFPHSAPPPAWIQWQTWDAQHYLYLAEYGYLPGDSSTAFFPLWPYCIKAAAPLFGGSYLIAGLVLANVLSIAALVLLWRLVRDLHDRTTADTALLLTLAYPGALFFAFAYSEALFLLLAVVAVGALARDQWRTACLAAFLLPLVRGVGIFIGVPMLYALVREWRATGALPRARAAGLAAPLAGLGVYFLIMAGELGDPFSGFEAQRQFISTRSVLDLVDVGGLLSSLADVSFGHGFRDSLIDRLFFVTFVAALVALWRSDRLLFFYALPLGLIPAMTSLMSFTRYLVVVFPVFVAAGALLRSERARYARWTVTGALLALQAVLVVRHVNFLWAG